jgi:sarcosine oxidase subunit gamma
LSTQHTLLSDVSDARAVFTLKGANVREVVAKLAPVDIAPSQFAPGEMRRTRFGQIATAFWMTGEDELKIICFRSVAEYMYKQLCICATQGSELDLWK